MVDDEELVSATEDLANRIAAFPKTGVRNIKRSFYMAAEDCFRSEETQASLKAFIESRRKKKKAS